MGLLGADMNVYKMLNTAIYRLKAIFHSAETDGPIITPLGSSGQPSLAEPSGMTTATPSPLFDLPLPLNLYGVTPKHVEDRQFKWSPRL